ncbi:IS66 family insertion sequence element accessory protein TnpB [Sinorhizobium fredii]|uniref:IS66 family insertion sequence element accessory protein TnpB n=1 Tax=Rhizobium fredii TaxID=380 RepID=UPI001F2F3761|nr:IS66 family insertion sequence element accessory protein TnpB [Sinorhizobium fredii]
MWRQPRLVETVIKEAPASGAIFGLRGKRADRIKLLWWDGQGYCLFYILSLANGEGWRGTPDTGPAFHAR